MILSGTLLTPTGEPLANVSLRLTAMRTSEDVLKFTTQDFRTGQNGDYEIDVPPGAYALSMHSPRSGQSYLNVGTLYITEDMQMTSISELLMLDEAFPSPSESFISTIEGSVVEVQQRTVEALEAVAIAVASKDTVESIKDQIIASTAFISTDENNRLTRGSDGGFYVLNDFNPDPLAHYILAKG
jgi:hypothetical protein